MSSTLGSLSAFLRPASVAIVGAGDRPTSSGGAVLRNLLKSGYRGRIVPVNPKGGELLGLPVVPSLSAVSPACELAVVVVRPDLILDVVREAAASGHRNLLVLPGGFAEGGDEGQARDRALRELAQMHDLRIAGPNCAGLIDLLDRTNPCASTFFRDMPRGGSVALISQSGAIAEEIIGSSRSLGIPVGAVASVGNAMQIGLTEYLEHFGADPACCAILLYVESFGEAERFRALARAITAHKPIVTLIGGRTAPGREAALRHTGSRAMPDAEADAFCADCGMVRVKSLRALMLAGKAFALYPSGIGQRVLLLSNSGGPGVLAADRCAELGLELPQLPAALAERLRAMYPAEAVVANPLDLLADAREDRFGDTLQAVLQFAQDSFDAILMIHVVPFMVDADAVVTRLAAIAKGASLPILHAMMGTLEGKQAWMARMEEAGVPMFDNVEDMAEAAAMLASRRAPSA
jgi:acyl-CoA synthetase (NDP forming)